MDGLCGSPHNPRSHRQDITGPHCGLHADFALYSPPSMAERMIERYVSEADARVRGMVLVNLAIELNARRAGSQARAEILYSDAPKGAAWCSLYQGPGFQIAPITRSILSSVGNR